jgi:hypothetical protein
MSAYIDINDDHELYIWARTFGITPDELVRVVSEVGSSPVRVRDALKRAEIARSGGRFLPEGSKPAASGSKSSSD